jgi:predicted DsbA family dithiol-disulfide isomerase
MVCPYCGNALGTIDQLWDEYPNKLRLVVKQMPVHAAAVLPAEAALAADAQGKFWELHDLMLAHQDDLSLDALVALAQQVGLDVVAFRAALEHHAYAAEVAADKAEAAALELKGVPAFVINGQRVIGIRPIQYLREIIDQALAHP